MKKVTILDIAKELNVTFSTVARALNDHPAISAATKKAVRETAERMNYRQNKIASSLRSGRTNVIGVVVPSLRVTFFSSVVAGIEQVMNANGYNILLYQSNETLDQEKKGIETFLQSRVDGIIASISTETTDYGAFHEIIKRKTPLIFFDRTIEQLDMPSVTIDDYKGGFIATEHLIRQGYRRILHISADREISIFKERLRGYIDALEYYNIPVDEELIIKGNFSLEFGKSVIREARLSGLKFDAVFALEDYTAMGVLQQLLEFKVKIPDEIGVIGFANEAFGSLVTPQLSTIDQQTLAMGKEVAKLFLKLKKDEMTGEKKLEKIVLDPLLIIRASSERHK
ncbi:LacI family DNA-binding transcriptional regulator [Pararcticibacter amylolyticus]|uniref:LacI family transcriptional regulator n=1 Tax=Pararcticibacter amylolyticus TaxID=2173175 RepID=A0A2U2PDC1_9SPHI|nr:LacI family DNA-binding transcriptional regulator [Pararcticibacter amylolyticus]PWG79363.1 LacI family transcriptional regulator [Pararcticibacter amylolyticus]